MRILLYAEPFPIRNSMTHFRDIARQFTSLLRTGRADVRLYANRETLGHLTADEQKAVGSHLLLPTDDEQHLFNSWQADWDSKGIARWRSLMSGNENRQYLQVLQSIWQRFPFDVIVHWGENAAIGEFCANLPVLRLAAEMGCTRPPFANTYVLDPYGTNGSGLVPRLSIEEIESIVGDQGLSAETALLGYSENLESVGYEKQFAPLNYDVLAAVREHGAKVAFLPLQLYDDANMLLFSDYGSVTDVVLDVVPKLVQAGYLVLVKPHPASKHRGSAVRENRAARAALAPWRSKVVWCDADKGDFENVSLMSVSDLVVTVNSSVGFEATYFDKTVVVLGEAVYKPKGLFPSLDDVISGQFDRRDYLRKLNSLRTFMLEGYLAPNEALRHPELFYERILNLAQIAEGGSPLDVAGRFYRAFSGTRRRHFRQAMFAGISVPGVNDFKLGYEKVEQFNVVSGVGTAIDPSQLVSNLAKATGMAFKSDLVHLLKQRWSEAEFRVAVVDELKLFDPKHYLAANRDVAEAGMDPKTHFILYGEAEARSPHPQIDLGEYLRTNGGKKEQGLLGILVDFVEASKMPDENDIVERDDDEDRIVVDYVMDEADENLIADAHRRLKEGLAESRNSVAVVAHLYYRDLVPEFLEQLDNLPPDFDLVVTLPSWGTKRIEEMVRARYPRAILCPMPNRGRDIGPFIEVLPHLLEKQYKCVLKLQTKRGYYVAGRMRPGLGRQWRELAYRTLIGSGEQVQSILGAFENLPGLMMVGPAPFFLSLDAYPYHDGGQMAAHYIERPPRRAGFFAGTMFWFRPDALAPLVTGANALTMRSFEADNSANDGQIAHLVERMFGHIAARSRMSIGLVDISTGEYSLEVGGTPASEKIHDYLVRQMEATEKKAAESLIW